MLSTLLIGALGEVCQHVLLPRRWIESKPAALETEYAMLLPDAATPATEEVIRKTPPSALALNVGRAFRIMCRFALQLTAQH